MDVRAAVRFNRRVPSDYRFSGPLVLRLLGAGLAGVGAFLLVLVVLTALLDLPSVVLDAGVLLAAAGVVALGLAATRGVAVVRLGEAGYRIRFVRGAGVRQGRWKDVEDVTTATVAGARCVVLRLRDGRTSTVPVGLLAGRTEDFVDDLREQLNRGHGYRSVPGRRA
ncbi:MAG: hypothetical protein QOF53_4039 [Nocardioidaceae bacterium]|nr:hypothetical protein [Nocardioidaceae bacterium]